MTTYYRIQPANRRVDDLLLPGRVSRAMVGNLDRRCDDCSGAGWVILSAQDRKRTCEVCKGHGRVEDVRAGVSCCRDIETLAAYFNARHLNTRGDVLIELQGDESDDEDHDSEAGAVLVHPTRIVSVTPIEESAIWDLLRDDDDDDE